MNRLGRPRALLVAVAAALLLPLGGGAAAGAGAWPPDLPPPPPVPDVTWAACGKDLPGLQCATVIVPLDYDAPGAATTSLALAKWPAEKGKRRIGTVFVNPGGPGGSGVGLVLSGFGQLLGANLDGRFDVVGFDPRGVGASDPLRCFPGEAALAEFFAAVPVFPYRGDQYRPFFEHYRGLAAECLDDRDDRRIARHMSTADVARDLDLLRRAVGDRRLSYLGFSYGSYLGMTYANLFPGKVRALAVDGVLDPQRWADGRHVELDRTSTRDVFREFLRLCDAARRACAFWAPGGAAPRWEALVQSLRRSPAVLPGPGGPFPYTYDLAIADSNAAMYAPEVWAGPDGYAAFLDGLADAVLGEQVPASGLVAARAALLDRLTATHPEGDYANFFDAYYGNHCADAQYPRSLAAFRTVGAYAAAGSRWGPLWWWGNAGCADWPVAPDRYTGPWNARTSAPVLVVGNYYDNATDYAGAVTSARLLPNSRLLSYAGWGHTAYGRSACVTAYVDAYLLDASLPPRGTVCPANANPFLPQAQLLAAGSGPVAGLPGGLPQGRQ
jgi:pimeloyl-ACP methyl ester carboxylesterase